MAMVFIDCRPCTLKYKYLCPGFKGWHGACSVFPNISRNPAGMSLRSGWAICLGDF